MSAAEAARALGEALILASEGRRCFPCSSNKRPASPHGFLDASADPMVLRELWANYPGQFVGVRTGKPSGMDALDLDRKHRHSAKWWVAYRDHLPVTRVHRTRSGGLHLLFRHTPGMRCSAGRIAPGVDVRGDGGYLIWWPAAGLAVLRDARTGRSGCASSYHHYSGRGPRT
jgi:Bifunctional DNA primase/polymerase, N-terminal